MEKKIDEIQITRLKKIIAVYNDILLGYFRQKYSYKDGAVLMRKSCCGYILDKKFSFWLLLAMNTVMFTLIAIFNKVSKNGIPIYFKSFDCAEEIYFSLLL